MTALAVTALAVAALAVTAMVVAAMGVAYLSGAVDQQNPMLLIVTALLLLGALRAWRLLAAGPQRHS